MGKMTKSTYETVKESVFLKNVTLKAGEMVLWVKTLAFTSEDLSSIP